MFERIVSYLSNPSIFYSINQCKADFAFRCNEPGWEPGVGLFWDEAWTRVGTCSGHCEKRIFFPALNAHFA